MNGFRLGLPSETEAELEGVFAEGMSLARDRIAFLQIVDRLWIRPLTVLVFHGGLVQIRGKRSDVFAWTDVALFEAANIDEAAPGWLRCRDGKIFAFKQLDPGTLRKLEDLARREVWQRHFPDALKKYEDGGIVEYGQLGVSKEGLVQNGMILAWAQIARIKVESPGRLVVRRRGSLFSYWFAKRIRKMPNFFIMRHFIEQNKTLEFETS